MNRTKLEEILRLPEGPLPRGKVRVGDFSLSELADAENRVVRELAEEQLRAISGMREAIEVLGADVASSPVDYLESWDASSETMELIGEVSRLPVDAGEGFMKLKGYLPTAINLESSMRYAALLLLFCTRALFLGERRGFDSILSSASARGFRYGHHLPPDGGSLIAGLPALYSVLRSPELSDPVYAFVCSIANAFSHDDRAFAALCVTRSLLVSCGRGASRTANEIR